jgi:HSP20 family protein
MFYRRLFDFPGGTFRNQFNELDRMRHQMERLFSNLSDARFPRVQAGVFPAINLTENKDNYFVRAELPGVKAENLDIQATGNGLSIAGERKIQSEDDGVKYHRRERESGSFARMISLPGEINSNKVDAKLSNGILTIVVPKAEIAKPKQITVK